VHKRATADRPEKRHLGIGEKLAHGAIDPILSSFTRIPVIIEIMKQRHASRKEQARQRITGRMD